MSKSGIPLRQVVGFVGANIFVLVSLWSGLLFPFSLAVLVVTLAVGVLLTTAPLLALGVVLGMIAFVWSLSEGREKAIQREHLLGAGAACYALSVCAVADAVSFLAFLLFPAVIFGHTAPPLFAADIKDSCLKSGSL